MNSRKNFLERSIKMMIGAAASVIDKKIPDNIKELELPLNPPGAVKEFQQLCDACNKCVEVCEANAIILEGHKVGKDFPYIKPSLNACEMCQDTPCITSCDRGALVKTGTDFPAIGIAELNKKSCLAYNGIHCTFCYDACPLKREAIRLKATRPIIIEENCTGCGICKNVCVAPEKAGILIHKI